MEVAVAFGKATHEVFDGLVGREAVGVRPALGASAPVEENILLARVTMVVAKHQRRFLPNSHQIFYKALRIKMCILSWYNIRHIFVTDLVRICFIELKAGETDTDFIHVISVLRLLITAYSIHIC